MRLNRLIIQGLRNIANADVRGFSAVVWRQDRTELADRKDPQPQPTALEQGDGPITIPAVQQLLTGTEIRHEVPLMGGEPVPELSHGSPGR